MLVVGVWHVLRYGSFDHVTMYDRDADGRLVAVCRQCGWSRRVLGDVGQ